jgi:hypothetical protein
MKNQSQKSAGWTKLRSEYSHETNPFVSFKTTTKPQRLPLVAEVKEFKNCNPQK